MSRRRSPKAALSIRNGQSEEEGAPQIAVRKHSPDWLWRENPLDKGGVRHGTGYFGRRVLTYKRSERIPQWGFLQDVGVRDDSTCKVQVNWRGSEAMQVMRDVGEAGSFARFIYRVVGGTVIGITVESAQPSASSRVFGPSNRQGRIPRVNPCGHSFSFAIDVRIRQSSAGRVFLSHYVTIYPSVHLAYTSPIRDVWFI